MKILNVSQVQQADSFTIENEPIASIDLMERASEKFVEVFTGLISAAEKIAVVCGPGNNGGDGLAVARLLLDKGYQVSPITVQPKDGGSDDFLKNAARLEARGPEIHKIQSPGDVPDFSEYSVIVDAVFGSGLTRPVTGIFAEVIKAVNSSSAKIISIDIPSGLFMDSPAPDGAIITAQHTISFQLPKLAFFFPENYPFVGDWTVVDIGLDQSFIANQDTSYFTLGKDMIRSCLPSRNKFDHKGSYGHVLLIGGSYGKMGAMVLSARAALRSGPGLVSVNIPRCGQEILQTSIPEVMLIDQAGQTEIQEFNVLEKANVIGIGPGLGMDKKTITAMGEFLRSNEKPLVIDADGLNIMAERTDYLELLPGNTILTPHLREFDRLAGDSQNNWERLDKARVMAQKMKVIIVLKGAHTAIIEPSGVISFNTTGNPGMATAGSGDVLLGIISGLLSQGIEASCAAKLGVYLHGLAGDLATELTSQRSLIAGDLVDYLGKAFFKIEQ